MARVIAPLPADGDGVQFCAATAESGPVSAVAVCKADVSEQQLHGLEGNGYPPPVLKNALHYVRSDAAECC